VFYEMGGKRLEWIGGRETAFGLERTGIQQFTLPVLALFFI
jgi:hypothetical protein